MYHQIGEARECGGARCVGGFDAGEAFADLRSAPAALLKRLGAAGDRAGHDTGVVSDGLREQVEGSGG